MGICVQRYIKYLKCHSFSWNFFREKSKKDRCGGTQERKMNARKQRKSGKTTVNSVNPSCSSALKLLFCQQLLSHCLTQSLALRLYLWSNRLLHIYRLAHWLVVELGFVPLLNLSHSLACPAMRTVPAKKVVLDVLIGKLGEENLHLVPTIRPL